MNRLPEVVGFLFLFILLSFFRSPILAADLVINEFVPAPSAVNQEWVELYNASASAEYLRTYYLDDDASFDSDAGSSAKKVLTGLNILNPHYPYFLFSTSLLNNDGDLVVLFDSAGTIVDQFTYFDNPGSDTAIGRAPDQSGLFAVVSVSTIGQPNAPPIPTPSPTPTPTSAPTSTPTCTPTPTPTPMKTPTPTPPKTPTPTQKAATSWSATDSAVALPSGVAQVLGDSDEQVVVSASDQGRSVMPAVISLALIGLGTGILSLALVWQKRNAILE